MLLLQLFILLQPSVVNCAAVNVVNAIPLSEIRSFKRRSEEGKLETDQKLFFNSKDLSTFES